MLLDFVIPGSKLSTPGHTEIPKARLPWQGGQGPKQEQCIKLYVIMAAGNIHCPA